MTNDRGEVTVVIPTYYRNDSLEEAVRSVRDQTYDREEIIVVDDSGEAYAEPVVETYDDIEYVPLGENEGPQTARTIGIERAQGRYVQLLDDDDRLRRDKLRKQVNVLERSDEAAVVYSGFSWADGRTVLPKRDVVGDVLDRALMFDTAPCITSTMLTEREVLERILPLTDRPGADDTGVKIELARLTEFEYVNESLVHRTESPDSRQNSAGKLRGQKDILDEYRNLYEEFPPYIYRTALAKTWLVKSMHLLDRNIWSFNAVSASGKALYYSPEKSTPYIGAFVASLFGRLGRDAALSTFQVIRGRNRRGKAT